MVEAASEARRDSSSARRTEPVFTGDERRSGGVVPTGSEDGKGEDVEGGDEEGGVEEEGEPKPFDFFARRPGERGRKGEAGTTKKLDEAAMQMRRRAMERDEDTI